MKILKIIVDEMPKNCTECCNEQCNLPLSKYREKVLKPYTNKRHPNCKLVLEEEKCKVCDNNNDFTKDLSEEADDEWDL